ncbi:ribosome-binding factor A [bacterium]|nr:MAG: ribosome-binding factor A [bacterium]
MSQRVAKVESVIQAVIAPALLELLEADGTSVTVTRVDAAPDLRNVSVWVGLLGKPAQSDRIWARIMGLRPELQRRVSATMTTRYAPVIHLKRDSGGEYSEKIERLLAGLDT